MPVLRDLTAVPLDHRARLIDIARNIAIEAHGTTRNKHDGELYVLHVSRAAANARTIAPLFRTNPYLAEAGGWLHDVVEDTDVTIGDIEERVRKELPCTWADLRRLRYLLDAVALVTKTPGVPNRDYYQRIKDAPSPLPMVVKLGDMTDNYLRTPNIVDPETQARLVKKYRLGYEIFEVTPPVLPQTEAA